MPRYYFHLSSKRCVTDPYGTVLIDKDAAMTHALVVARELMFNSTDARPCMVCLDYVGKG